MVVPPNILFCGGMNLNEVIYASRTGLLQPSLREWGGADLDHLAVSFFQLCRASHWEPFGIQRLIGQQASFKGCCLSWLSCSYDVKIDSNVTSSAKASC